MIEQTFDDTERQLLVRGVLALMRVEHGEQAMVLVGIISKLAGTDTVLVAHRACEARTYDERLTAAAAFCDPRFDPRHCDRCGRRYQGPAVYCSLWCAMADA